MSGIKKRKSPRHPFRFRLESDETEKPKIITAWAKVKKATKKVTLTLTAADVRRSIRLEGVGNTQTCSMAVCGKRQAGAFPHPVEGFIDWQYTTAYVVTKVSKETGFPTECVAYEHDDEIAKLNDSEGGQLKLLKRLEEKGDRVIYLRPPKKQTPANPGRPEGKSTGQRSSRPAHLSSAAMKRPVGARLRYATAKAGGVIT